MAAAPDSSLHLDESFPPVSMEAPPPPPPLPPPHVCVADAALLGASARTTENGSAESLAGVSLEPSDGAASSSDPMPRTRRALGSVAGLFFTIKPLLEGSLFSDAPAVPLERCAHRFEQLHQLQPFLWVRQLAHFSHALLIFAVFMAVTLIFFSLCTSQWFHLLFTVPWIFFIGCELTFGDRSAFDECLIFLRSLHFQSPSSCICPQCRA